MRSLQGYWGGLSVNMMKTKIRNSQRVSSKVLLHGSGGPLLGLYPLLAVRGHYTLIYIH